MNKIESKAIENRRWGNAKKGRTGPETDKLQGRALCLGEHSKQKGQRET